MGGGGDPADCLSQRVGASGQQVARARSGQGSPSRSNFPACSGAPGCRMWGVRALAPMGAPLPLPLASRTPTKPGAPSMTAPFRPTEPAHPSPAQQPRLPFLGPASSVLDCTRLPDTSPRLVPPQPDLPPSALLSPQSLASTSSLCSRPSLAPHLGLSHSALPILHSADRQDRQPEAPSHSRGPGISHVTPH